MFTGEFSVKVAADRDTNLTLYLPAMFDVLAVKGDHAQIRRSTAHAHAYDVILEAGHTLYIEHRKERMSIQE